MTAGDGGYPDKARRTPVPDLFFSRDLVDIDDPAEIKVMLHALWRIARRERGAPAALRRQDLAADTSLRRGLLAVGVPEPDLSAAVGRACASLSERGLLIRAEVVGDAAAGRGPETWYLVNDTDGRALHARLERGERLLPSLPAAPLPAEGAGEVGAAHGAGAGAGARIFELYEANIGMLTPLLAEELREAAATYPQEWLEDAFRAALANNARKWSYVRAILERWARDGRGGGGGGGRGGRDDGGIGGGGGRKGRERVEGRDGEAHGDDRRRDRTAARSDRKDPYGAWIKR